MPGTRGERPQAPLLRLVADVWGTVTGRDILLLSRVDKPALLRQLFRLGCDYSGQILADNKMLGQLHDAGNTTTLAHYLELLSGAGMITGLQKFAGTRLRQRGSSPKLVVLNTALMTATSGRSQRDARSHPDVWGREVESAIGAHLVATLTPESELFYWRERDREVDFVLRRGTDLIAIEVASAMRKDSLPGTAEFARAFGPARKLLVGGQGITVEEFLLTPAEAWFD